MNYFVIHTACRLKVSIGWFIGVLNNSAVNLDSNERSREPCVAF